MTELAGVDDNMVRTSRVDTRRVGIVTNNVGTHKDGTNSIHSVGTNIVRTNRELIPTLSLR